MSTQRHKWNRLDFIEYLKKTLIPDLKDSGKHATAEDFETAVFFMDTVPCWFASRTTGLYTSLLTQDNETTDSAVVVQRHERVYRRYEE